MILYRFYFQIAASYGKKVCIFEPTPLLHPDSTHVRKHSNIYLNGNGLLTVNNC